VAEINYVPADGWERETVFSNYRSLLMIILLRDFGGRLELTTEELEEINSTYPEGATLNLSSNPEGTAIVEAIPGVPAGRRPGVTYVAAPEVEYYAKENQEPDKA
jgi:hypothetical protein